jgi:hypothetical protein
LQVVGVVGHDDERADVAAGGTPGEMRARSDLSRDTCRRMKAMPLICCSSRPPARTRMAHEMGRALAFDATLRPSPFASGHCRRHRPVAQTR